MKPRRPCGRGFTLLELGVALAVIVVVAVLLIRALMQAQAAAERASVQMTVMQLRSLLRFEIAQTVIRGAESQLEHLIAANPVRWMVPPMTGYVGEKRSGELQDLYGGQWAFDLDRRQLVYRPVHEDQLLWPPDRPRVLRWAIKEGAATGLIHGIDLVAIDSVIWGEQPVR